MRLLLNVIWLLFGGLWLALGNALVALVMCILIITIPFGIAAGRMALLVAVRAHFGAQEALPVPPRRGGLSASHSAP